MNTENQSEPSVEEIPSSDNFFNTNESFGSSPFAEILSSTEETHPVQDDEGALNLAPYAERAYLEYAMSVVMGRSLPDFSDGQKPVQRRILYSMRSMGLTSTSKHIKSARVVGECMGKYHPHGDSSIYDAMVLSSQDFSRRYPLVDGQGNFGSRDGDGAAAMRYTEARLTPIAELLLSELDMGTVDFVPNYDGAFEEPSTLPARLPFVLLNGSKGAAVGYAVEIPSHNLREVAAATCHLIKHPDASLEEVMQHLPAPDFPGGGQLICPINTIREAYRTGRGSLRMRARWRREELARGQWRVVIYELPHGISSANVLSEIEALTNPQPRAGKKELNQEQKNVKALMLGLIDSARDESDKAQPVRLVIEPKTSKISEDDLMNALLAQTSLEYNAPVNLVVLGRDGNPNQKSLLDILKEWIGFRYVTVERRIKHRLGQVEKRLHILDGRMKAFLHIDEVIRVIREADEPKAALIERFGLSEIQAEDILEIRLRQLARLEGIKIEKEIAELREEEAQLRKLLANRDLLTKLIISEIESDAKKYGDERRTLVEPVEAIRAAEVSVADEPVTIIVSRNGWIRSRHGHGIDKSTISWKQSDGEMAVLETRTTSTLYVLDSKGRAYNIKASVVPGGRGDGVPVSTLIDLQAGSKVAHVLAGDPSSSYLFSNSASYGFITQLRELETRQKTGKAFMTIEEEETVLAPVPVKDMGDALIATCASDSEVRLLIFPVNEMKVLPKGRGVMIMNLQSHERMTSVDVVQGDSQAGVSMTINGKEVLIKGHDLKKYCLHRARKGVQVAQYTGTSLALNVQPNLFK